jgi:hypothetical protein
MARIRCMLTVLVLGSAIISRPAVAQLGSSVSLTHTVTVTVPPRVRVQVGSLAPIAQSASRVSTVQGTDGLSLSINATQSWTLAIGSASAKSRVQWSHDVSSGFADVSSLQATVASGEISQTPTTAKVFFRNVSKGDSSIAGGAEGSEAVMLTVVAP